MSHGRTFGARELALCLVILASAICLGATIITTAVSARIAVASVTSEKVNEMAPTPGELISTDGADQVGFTGPEPSGSQSSTDTPSILPAVDPSPETIVTGDSAYDLVDREASASDPSAVTTEADPEGQDAAGADPASTLETGNSGVVLEPPEVVVLRHPETSRALLKADYEELRESGLDIASALKYIDQWAKEGRYGNFGSWRTPTSWTGDAD
jgi:hypothetical protein